MNTYSIILHVQYMLKHMSAQFYYTVQINGDTRTVQYSTYRVLKRKWII